MMRGRYIDSPKGAKTPMSNKKQNNQRFDALSRAALEYGERSFDNYAQVRSVAERLRDGLCAYLDNTQTCVFLVPPQGPFQSTNYGSAAFSVAGKGFLPLEPISFGLAVRVSREGDFMRLVITCRKEGERLFINIDANKSFEVDLPMNEAALETCQEGLYQYLLEWFSGRVNQYDHGRYGSSDIGFDIQRIDGA